jgi:hypothetical protein
MTVSASESLSPLLSQSLSACLERVKVRVHALAEPLSPEQFWRRPFPYGNSFGHLVLHVTGNLSYYIGAQIAGTGYVRDRPKEFADSSHRAPAEVLRAFDEAIAMVSATLAAQGPGDWQAPYSGAGAEDVPDRLGMFVRCAAHADHHAGQMIYICKQLGLS